MEGTRRRLPLRLLAFSSACLGLLGMVPAVFGQGVPSFFVSPQGNDTWSGTLDKAKEDRSDGPFATVEHALQARRQLQLQASGQPAPDIVIREGTYRLGKTVMLEAGDSGTAAHPFRIAAYPGEHPVLDGTAVLPAAWKQEGQGPLWSLQLPASFGNLTDLFVNGVRQPRSRLPHQGFWHAILIDKSRTQFRFAPGQLQAWPDAANGIVIIKPFQWLMQYRPIRSINGTTQTVTLADEADPMTAADHDPHIGEYSVENLRAGVDQPGAWCFDPARKIVLFQPPEGIDPNRAEIAAAVLPILVSVTGNSAKDRWAEHIRFEGLAFTRAAGFKPRPYSQDAAFFFSGGVRLCEVRQCSFTDLGSGALVLQDACRDNVIAGNQFLHDGGFAIGVFGTSGPGPAASSGNRIENNTLSDCGRVMQDAPGIELHGTADNLVAHNAFSHLPYNGITLDGERPQYWHAGDSPGVNPPYSAASIKPFIASHGNRIEWNHFDHVMESLADGGAIYLWGVMGKGANQVSHNLVENVGAGEETVTGIYLDDDCDDVTVTDNLIRDAGFGLQLHGASRNLIENNFFLFLRRNGLYVQPEKYNVRPMESVVRRNIFAFCAGPMFRDTSWAAWDRLPLKECDFNLYWKKGEPVPLGQGSFAGLDSHSVVADPRFEAPEQGKFLLGADSPALPMGIHSIDLQGVGPLPEEK